MALIKKQIDFQHTMLNKSGEQGPTMKRANLLSNKEKGYLLSPEYRLQVKHTNITPHTTKNKFAQLSGRNGSVPDMRIQEEQQMHGLG